VVSRATGIPVSKMMQGERDKLLQMEDALHKRVVGQNEAVRLVSDAIRRSRSVSPIPTVRTARSCSSADGRRQDRALQGARRVPVRLRAAHDPRRHVRVHGEALGGAADRRAARYVGYEEGGHLTEAVRRKPYSVILLDEVEKAHPDVFNVLLQVLDDGRMTDGRAAPWTSRTR